MSRSSCCLVESRVGSSTSCRKGQLILDSLRLVAGLSLLISPGAWLAFGLPLRELPLLSRMALSGILSPLVVVLEFYVFRLGGLSYSATMWLLFSLNTGSLIFVAREWRRTNRPRWEGGSSWSFDVAVFVFLVACVSVPWFFDHGLRIFGFHAWMHASIVNQFAIGRVVPEEPELAGVRLAYPWLGHLYWSVLSWATNWPHTRVYVLTDIAFLGWTCIAVMESCRALGVPPPARRQALIWLTLGTNVLGFWIMSVSGWLPGDIRYTPWLRKFMISELSAFVIAMLAALMMVGLVALRARPHVWLVMVSVVTASIGLFYVILLPAALSFSGMLLVMLWFDPRLGVARPRRTAAAWLAVGLVLAVAGSATYFDFVTATRSSAPVALSPPEAVISKLATGLIAIAPFLLAIAFIPRRRWLQPEVTALLGASALCFLARPAVQMGAFNEYKFMFPTVLFLAPVAALLGERWTSKRVPADWLVLASALILLPTLTARPYDWIVELLRSYPPVYEAGTSMVLDAHAPDASWIAAVRAGTPSDTVIAVGRAEFLLPVLTERSLLGPPVQTEQAAPGYWELSRRNLESLRGYPAGLVDGRTGLLQDLFADEVGNPTDLLARVKALDRPVAIVYGPVDDRAFLAWLQQEHHGRELHRDTHGFVVWLVD